MSLLEFSQTTVIGELLHRPNWVVLRTFSKSFRLAAIELYALAIPENHCCLENPLTIQPTYLFSSCLGCSTTTATVTSIDSQLLAERAELTHASSKLKSRALPALFICVCEILPVSKRLLSVYSATTNQWHSCAD